MKLTYLVITLAVLVSGCTYNIQPLLTQAINISSSYQNKIPGRFAVVIDDSIRNVNREVKPVSFVCRGSSYKIALGDSLAVAVKDTLDAVFEQTVAQSTMPSNEVMTRLDLRGAVLVKIDDFSPKLSCSMGFFWGSCSGVTDISLSVNIRDSNGILFETSVAGSKTFDGSTGPACSGGTTVLAESINGATRDVLERMAEIISRTPRLRPNGSK